MNAIIRSATRWAMGLCAVIFSLTLMGCSFGASLGEPIVRDAEINDVVFFGDSIFQLSGEIQDQVELRAGTTFRTYAVPGAQLEGGFIAPTLSEQIDMAFEDNSDIRVAIVSGGGNDILVPAIALDSYQCKTRWYRKNISQKCKDFIDDLYVKAVDLVNNAGERGVEHIYVLGYYYVKDAFFRLDSLEQTVDYGGKTMEMICANVEIGCTYVDPRQIINDDDIKWDGIHPEKSGSIKIGNLIWESGLKNEI